MIVEVEEQQQAHSIMSVFRYRLLTIPTIIPLRNLQPKCFLQRAGGSGIGERFTVGWNRGTNQLNYQMLNAVKEEELSDQREMEVEQETGSSSDDEEETSRV